MRLTPALKFFAKASCAWALCSSPSYAEEFSATLEQGPWVSAKDYLTLSKPQEPEIKIPALEMMKDAFVKGLKNPDQQKEVLRLQGLQGTKASTFGEGYLVKQSETLRADQNSTHGTRWTLFRNMKTYAGKEIRFDFVPESVKNGFRFDPTAPKETPKVSTITGTPVKYGLILKNIDPADQEMRLASVGGEDDLAYFQTAPKAKLQYDIGPIALSPVPQTYNFNQAPDAPSNSSFDWKSIIPDHRFKARFSPRGAPTAAKPLPDQTMTLEQVQGYYSTEVQFVNGLHKQSLLHRFRLPIHERFNVSEELSESFKPVKLVVSDLYSSGPVGTTIEHYFMEKRYRAGIYYKQGATTYEIYANAPDNALNDKFKKTQRWELNILTPI
ncbi:MAG: hypothetical protein H7249_10850 [Chitinophagaceae bacterium]|nr:hypothetical protein [Oligoflexus sp.]